MFGNIKTKNIISLEYNSRMLLFVQIMVLLKMNMKLENSSYGGTDKRFHSVPFCVVLYIEKTVLPNNKI